VSGLCRPGDSLVVAACQEVRECLRQKPMYAPHLFDELVGVIK
jgi:hypothetical protein